MRFATGESRDVLCRACCAARRDSCCDMRVTHDTYSGASPQLRLGWKCPPQFFQKFFLRFIRIGNVFGHVFELDSPVAKCVELGKFAASVWNRNSQRCLALLSILEPTLRIFVFYLFCACTPRAKKTKLVHASTTASSSSAILEQTRCDTHGKRDATRTTCSSRRAGHVVRVMSWRNKWNFGL